MSFICINSKLFGLLRLFYRSETDHDNVYTVYNINIVYWFIIFTRKSHIFGFITKIFSFLSCIDEHLFTKLFGYNESKLALGFIIAAHGRSHKFCLGGTRWATRLRLRGYQMWSEGTPPKNRKHLKDS